MNVPSRMKAASVERRGPPRFEVRDVPVPRPGPGQVLVKVLSAGVNFSDVKRRRGDAYPFETRFPFVPGGEVAGEIVAHGEGVEGPPIGSSVFALAGDDGTGGYAQYAVVHARTAIPIPQGLPIEAASVLLVAGSTAKLMLRYAARLEAGESILVPAATGGVGSFVIQLARRMKAARVIAAVGDSKKRESALALGAHDVVTTSSPNWPDHVRELSGGKGVDVALEATGGDVLEQTFRCLAPFGRLVVFGAASGTSASLSPATLERLLYAPAPNQSLAGFNVGAWFMGRPMEAAAALTELVGEVLAGHVRVPRIATLCLEQASEAHELLESGKTSGKMVIKPWST